MSMLSIEEFRLLIKKIMFVFEDHEGKSHEGNYIEFKSLIDTEIFQNQNKVRIYVESEIGFARIDFEENHSITSYESLMIRLLSMVQENNCVVCSKPSYRFKIHYRRHWFEYPVHTNCCITLYFELIYQEFNMSNGSVYHINDTLKLLSQEDTKNIEPAQKIIAEDDLFMYYCDSEDYDKRYHIHKIPKSIEIAKKLISDKKTW